MGVSTQDVMTTASLACKMARFAIDAVRKLSTSYGVSRVVVTAPPLSLAPLV